MENVKKEEKKGASPKRKVSDRPKDFEFIIPLFLEGVRADAIVGLLQPLREYPVDRFMIYRDIQHILKGWKEERVKLIPAALEIQLRKLEKMETVCWAQFEESKKAKVKNVDKQRALFDKKTKKQVGDMVYREGQKHVTETIGDGQWLDRIFKCWEMQSELLQLKQMAAPPQQEEVPTVGELVFITRTRKNNSQFTDAIEVPEEDQDGTGIQKLLQS